MLLALRVEWLRSRARSERYREEILFLQEEQRRTIVSLEKYALEWDERARIGEEHAPCPLLREGLAAYAAERAAFLKNAPIHARGLSQCDTQLKARGHEKANVARRQHMVEHLRHKRGLVPRGPLIKSRDLETALNTRFAW